MGRVTNGASSHVPPQLSPYLSFLFLLFLFFHNVSAKGRPNASATMTYSPPDNFLIDCGATQTTKLPDGRAFKSDREASNLLSTNEDFKASADSIKANVSSSIPPDSLVLFQTARIFSEHSTYTFHINKPGRHWIRLYFYPLPHQTYNLSDAVFEVDTDRYVLLHDFSASDKATLVFKEYLVNISDNRISLHFKPKKKSVAFVNAIEVVSAPDSLFNDTASTVPIAKDFPGLQNYAFQVRYRLNVGGPLISPQNDTLSRTWEPDTPYNAFPQGSQNVSVAPNVVKYPKRGESGGGVTTLTAPNWIYATAQHMQDATTINQKFNLSWKISVEEDFSYLIRLHFCDIVSNTTNSLYFNVYINSMMAVSNLDLSTLTGALSTAFYKDFLLNSTAVSTANNSINIQIGPGSTQSGIIDGLLNGVEVLKLSNIAESFDGLFGVDGKYMLAVKPRFLQGEIFENSKIMTLVRRLASCQF